MATFEVQGQDGQTYEVQADSLEAAVNAIASVTTPNQGGSSTNPGAVSDLGNRMDAGFHGLHNGAFLGFGDNVQGGMNAALGANPLNPSEYFGGMGNRYVHGRDQYREQLAAKEAQFPAETTAGNIAGAMIPALATAPLATGKTMLGTIARGTGLGAVEGAAMGAGYADGRNVGESALKGGALGAGLGFVAPAIVGAAGLAKNAIKDPITGGIDALMNRANVGKANRAVGGALKSSGKTQQEISAMLARATAEGQPEFRMMDALGLPGQRQASGVARAGGDAGSEIADFLASRQAGQSERVSDFVDEAFATKGTTAAKTTEALTKARGDAANTAYDAARGNAAPVDVRGALGVIDNRIGGMQGAGIAGDGIDAKLSGYRARLAGSGKGLGPGVTGAELSDFDRVLGVKQSIQDDIGAAVRAGRNNEARELGKLASELDRALEASSDAYRAANDGFRASSNVIGAVDAGSMMASSGRAADNIQAFSVMNPDMQKASRVGYGDWLLQRLEANASPTSNKAKPLIQSQKRAAEAQAMALDPELYTSRLGRENIMWETQNKALGGSRTADNLADQSAIEGLAGGALGAVRNSRGLVDMGVNMISALGPLAKGQNEATRKLIAKALMSGDGSVLAPILRQASTSEAKRRAVEALVRNLARGPMQGLVE